MYLTINILLQKAKTPSTDVKAYIMAFPYAGPRYNLLFFRRQSESDRTGLNPMPITASVALVGE
jgi:hypothetical protein